MIRHDPAWRLPLRRPPRINCAERRWQLEDIEHRTTKARSPRTNGFFERMNRTLLNECFRVAGRTTWYVSPVEIQRDLDRFLELQNRKRSHQAYRLKSRTPAQALREALGRKKLPPIVPKVDTEAEKEAA